MLISSATAMDASNRQVEPPLTGRFVTAILPWLAGCGGLLLYLLTLNTWVSLYSLANVARVSGWLWRPELGQPLTQAICYPFHWLPGSWIPVALNVFTAACAALVLAQLARSVALLPHDLTPSQPFATGQPVEILAIPTSWMPPVLAAMLCGLQLTFWEHATCASGEMIDLFLFAFVIRCLLEFRIAQKQAWLSRAAFVYATGMANDWAFVGYLPILVAAIVRTKGLGAFLDRRFLLRMSLWGLAGLSLYLLVPLAHLLAAHDQVGFWTALQANLHSQKNALAFLRRPAFRLLIFASLLPLVVLSVRWKAHSLQFADDSRLGVFLRKTTSHLLHGCFFALSLWLALDPSFSPRNLGLGTSMLTYYYSLSLVFGYCAGYFLLLGTGPGRDAFHRVPEIAKDGDAVERVPTGRDSGKPDRRLTKTVLAGAWVLLVALPALLVWRNFGQIKWTNGSALRTFARQLCADLPDGRAVVLSEYPAVSLLLRTELRACGRDNEFLVLEMPSLVSAQYQLSAAKQFRDPWPVALPTNTLDTVDADHVSALVRGFAAHEPVVSVQQDVGFLFEQFTFQPNGFIQSLKTRGPRREEDRAVEVRMLQANERLWEQRWNDSLQALAEQTQERPEYPIGWNRPLRQKFHLANARNLTASVLGAAYSKALNSWGVQMQRLDQWPEAGKWFRRALSLNPDNLSAQINALYNERCLQGDRTRLDAVSVRKEFGSIFAKYPNFSTALSENGPVDEPTFLLNIGRILLDASCARQAASSFLRSAELAPDWLAPTLWLAQSSIQSGAFAPALKLTESLKTDVPPDDGPHLSQLLYCQAVALRGLGETTKMAACIEKFVKEHGAHNEVLLVAEDLYAQTGQLEADLAILNEMLRREPDRADLLVKRGRVHLQLSKYDEAIADLTKVLSLAPGNHAARLCRAIAYSGADQLEPAREDYQQLLNNSSNAPNALFGLGTIAWRQRDTNAAIQFYQRYLSTCTPESPRLQYASAFERLRQLKGEQKNGGR